MRILHSTLAAISGIALAVWPHVAGSQHAAKVYRLGEIYMGSAPEESRRVEAFRQALRDLGYVEGRNVVFERRYAEGKPERLPELAAELVRLKVDIIVAAAGVAALATKKVTQTIPIVMAASGDAVRQGIVASLARPGGNVTGLTLISPELSRKRLAILREIVPQLSHVGVLWCGPGAGQVGKQEWTETQAAANSLGVQLVSLEAANRAELASAFALAVKQRVQAIIMFDCSRLNPSVAQIVELSRQHRLPGMYPFPRFAEAGGLVGYGSNEQDRPVRAASYVDRILKGAKPADLPVEQPVNFDLAINVGTARSLGLNIPQSLLLRANRVIE
jgi:putative ABC transport system substrate-binding protein